MNGYWKCEFEDKNGKIIEKMIIADTTRQAMQQAFESGKYFGIEPKYETLTRATEKEVRALKRMIKKRVKEKISTS